MQYGFGLYSLFHFPVLIYVWLLDTVEYLFDLVHTLFYTHYGNIAYSDLWLCYGRDMRE